MPQQTPTSFNVRIYGELTPYQLNPSMSKARVSVFRKYANANGSYFTDEVANNMVNNMAGIPIVGHYDNEKHDFTSHLTIQDTKAYGFIPPNNPNFAWQPRVQNDGQTYEYACFDIVLWTNRYEEAKQIINKSQSMELNPYQTFGSWEEKDGVMNFVYTSTMIYGLCVLGDSVRPCFDAACFYTQNQQQISSFMEAIKAEIKNNFSYTGKENDGGREDMPNENIEMPQEDSQLQNQPQTVDEEKEQVEQPAEVEQQPADNVEAPAEEPAPAEQPVQEENHSVTFSQQELDKAVEDAVASLKIQYQQKISDLNTKIEQFEAANYPATIAQLQQQLQNYQSKEAEELGKQKDELISSYADSVDNELLDDVKSNKDNYSLDEIESKLAVSFARAMRKNNNRVPTGAQTDEDSTLALLNRHLQNKRGNK